MQLTPFPPPSQATPSLSRQKDGDGRLPIHWAASSNSLDTVALLAGQASFDPDAQVSRLMGNCLFPSPETCQAAD